MLRCVVRFLRCSTHTALDTYPETSMAQAEFRI